MKKNLLLITSIVCISLGLTGCGKKDTTNSKKNHTNQQEIKAELPKNFITEKPLELTISMHFRDKYYYDDQWEVSKEAERLTNISLKNTGSTASTNSKEAFNLTIVSGNLPDIIGGNRLKDQFSEYGMEGAFIPLNDLIDKYAPNIKKLLEEKPGVLTGITSPDGNIYFIPYVPDGDAGRGYFIRKDWLKKLGLESPKSVDDLYVVLKAFREQDPNGNGLKDEVPVFNRHWQETIRLANLWGARVHGSDLYQDFYVEDGVVKHGFLNKEFKTGMENLAKWYSEGIIDPEFATRGKKSRDILLRNNLGGFTHDWFASTSNYTTVLKDKFEGFDFSYIAPPADINGKVWEEHGRKVVQPDGWAITFANEHPIETIKYFDFFFSEEGRRLANFGVEGKEYVMVNDKPVFNPQFLDASTTPVLQKLYEIGAQIPRGFYQDFEYEKQLMNEGARAGAEEYINNNYIVEQFPGVIFTPEEKKIYDKNWPSIATYMDEMTQNWLLGTKDVDGTWEAYEKTLKELKVKEVLEVVQSAYDRQYK